jgi:hypothetical protein
MNKFGRNKHYSYFELMHEIMHYRFENSMYDHPKYNEYREWKKNKIAEDAVRKGYERVILEQQRRVEEQIRITIPKKKKFLFW